MLSKATKEKYEAGFDVYHKEPMCNEEWLFSEEHSTDNKLVFLGYDANLWALPDFSKRPKTKWNEYVKKCGLERTKSFAGEVWLDDVRIK